MRKWIAVLSIATVALFSVSVDAQSVPRNLQKGDATSAVQPAPNAPNFTVADLPSTETRGTFDPALISPTGVRGGFESGMLASRGSFSATASTVVSFGPPCQIVCAGTAEAEVCGTDSNGGCTVDFCLTPGFEAINSGDTICGTVFADQGARDLDYFQLPIPAGPSTLTVTFESEFEGQVFLIEAGAAGAECSGSVVLDTDFSSACTPVTIQRAIGTQQYYLAVTTGNAAGPIFDGVTCAAGANEYSLSVDLVGADCLVPVGTAEADVCVLGAGEDPDTNDGCNFVQPVPPVPFPFSGPVTVGAAVTSITGNCSTGIDPATGGAVRDTDWWEIDIPAGPQDITITYTSEFPGALFLLNDQTADCVNIVQVAELFSGGCIQSTVTTQGTGGAGRWLLVALPGDALGGIFTGIPCGTANDYQIDISATPQACPTTCGPVCGAGAVPEGEVCPALPSNPDDFNGGCNATVAGAFSFFNVGDEVCGTAWADSGTRDTDWYKFTAFSGQTVDITINSTIPVDFFVLGEVDGAAGSLELPCDLTATGITVDLAGNHPGDCIPQTQTGVQLTLDPVLQQRDYVVFVAPADAAGALFSGFPCVCDFEYSISVTPSATSVCNFPTGTIDSDCATGDVTVNLVAASSIDAAGVTVDIEGFGQAAGFTQQVVIPGPFAVAAPITQVITPPLGPGVYTFDISGTCTAGDTFAAVATIGHHPYNGETDLIFAGEGADGCIDSVAALEASLLAANRTVVVIDNLFTLVDGYDCLDSADTIWMALGSFPNNNPMLASEGTALQNAVLFNDQSVYVEGGDVWGFDAPTDFFEVDGVEGIAADGTLILDGDDSCLAVTGSNANPNIDTTPFAAAYNQDSNNVTQFNADDFTDQLIPSTATAGATAVDSPIGSTHTVIFTETTALYGVAIASEGPDDTTGKVISSAIEFGGFGGNQDALMAEYVAFLKEAGPPPGDRFSRANCNADAAFNIADAIFLLGVLFPGAGGANVPPCDNACDANDDNGLNIADAIFMLSVLFPGAGGPPTLAEPLNCDVDPTPGPLTCPAFPPCP